MPRTIPPDPEKRLSPRSVTRELTGKGANPDDSGLADLNKIMANYRRSGTIPNVGLRNPLYGDFTGPQDLATALDQVETALQRFNDLPSPIRDAAGGDPVQFLDMFNDPAQREILITHGLIVETNNERPTNENPSQNSPPTSTPATTPATPAVTAEDPPQGS